MTVTVAAKPSGLAKDWQRKGISRDNRKETATSQDVSMISPPVSALGGLADEDADSQRPSSTISKGQDVARKNEASLHCIFVRIQVG